MNRLPGTQLNSLHQTRVYTAPFNGSDAMLSLRAFVANQQSMRTQQAIVTLFIDRDSEWTRTINIPLTR